MMPCPDENDLVGYVEGLLVGERKAEVVRHLDACATCRMVIVGMARRGEDHAEQRPQATEVVPADLLRQYLERDAPARESALSALFAGVALFAICFLTFGPPVAAEFKTTGRVIMFAQLGYESVVLIALRRGWYRPALPVVSTVVENVVVFAMQLNVLHNLGPLASLISPGAVLWSVLIMFTAIRARPWLCVLAAVLAASGTLIAAASQQGQIALPIEASPWAPRILQAIFFIVAGVAGTLVARYLVGRADRALRAIREQDLFGKYILHERLGSGGMGDVFRATYCPEGGFVRTVAVKRMRADVAADRRLQDAFRREARLSSSLSHPNLVHVLDCGTFRGDFVLAMEYVDGVALARLVRDAVPLEPAAVAFIGSELASALAYVHKRRAPDGAQLGLVHADVNPPNVLVSRAGEVKLGDFGVAHTRIYELMQARFAGKLGYAAPEQLDGGPLDARTDLFALGLTLYECLVGTERLRALLVRGDMPSVTAVRSEVPTLLAAVIDDLIKTNPVDRPVSAEAVRTRLLALDGDAAPYPGGEASLVRCVERVLGAAELPNEDADLQPSTQQLRKKGDRFSS